MLKSALHTPRFTVVDAADGLFRLEKRSPTLRGSVPLRVAQACVPLLEGNAFGFQVSSSIRLPFERRPLGWWLALAADEESRLVARFRAARQRLIAANYLRLDDPWLRVLQEETLFGQPSSRLGIRPRLRLWTGMLVRPDRGLRLRLFRTANRRAHGFSIREESFADPDRFVPLILDLNIEKPAIDARSLTLLGELACLAAMPAAVHFSAPPLAENLELGRAHAAFYAPSYFQKKATAPTRRYRQQIDVGAAAREATAGSCEVIACGPCDFDIVPNEHARFRNLLDFSFRFDGQSVALRFDKALLERRGLALWQNFSSLYGPQFVAQHEGALLYLSKYFTTHPPGEPHFFVKPWAFTRTPPGWSCLVEGQSSDGYDVMRGVVATDQFHATPAVFSIFRADAEITVAAAAPLMRLFPVPRTLLRAGFRLQKLGAPPAE